MRVSLINCPRRASNSECQPQAPHRTTTRLQPLKRTHTGIRLQDSSAAGNISCPFQPPQVLQWNDVENACCAQKVSIKQGLDLLRLELRIESPILTQIDFSERKLVLGYISSGWAKIESHHSGVEKLEPGQWFCFADSDWCFDRTSSELVCIDLFVCSQTLTRSLLNLDHTQPQDSALKRFADASAQVAFNSGQMNRSTFEAAQRIAHSPIDGLQHRLQLEANVLCWIAAVLGQTSRQQPRSGTLNAHDRDAIERIVAHIRHDPGREYSIHDLCQLGRLNEHKLKSAFKEIVGSTAFTFLREVRMDYAAQLLKDDRHSVIQVANEVGYSNASHFARAFKNRHGLLPKAYQCLHRLP